MTRLDREARVAIEALVSRGTSKAAVALLLGEREHGSVSCRADVGRRVARPGRQGVQGDAVRRRDRALAPGATDGAMNLAALHEWLMAEHGYDGSLRSVQRFWAKHYPARRSGRGDGSRRRRGRKCRRIGRTSRT